VQTVTDPLVDYVRLGVTPRRRIWPCGCYCRQRNWPKMADRRGDSPVGKERGDTHSLVHFPLSLYWSCMSWGHNVSVGGA
jgi:hypothetical protein